MTKVTSSEMTWNERAEALVRELERRAAEWGRRAAITQTLGYRYRAYQYSQRQARLEARADRVLRMRTDIAPKPWF